MTHLDPWYEAREAMRLALEHDLMGGEEDERLDEPPLDRYVVGILHPPSAGPLEDAGAVPDAETGGQPDAEYDPGVNLAHLRYPSSMGLTFGVDPSRSPVVVLELTADRYVPEVSTDGGQPPVADPSTDDARSAGRPQSWNRIPLGPIERTIDVTRPGRSAVAIADGLGLRVVVRPTADGVASVTAVLVNEFIRSTVGRVDEWCWFRPRIVATTSDGDFSDRRRRKARSSQAPDDRSTDLLYREATSVAVGHGCSVTWDVDGAIDRVETTFFPRHDLRVSRATRDDVPSLGMSTLSRSDDRIDLLALVDAYDRWIEGQARQIADLEPGQREAAEGHVAAARLAARRMRAGIAALDGDPVAGRAFRVMNAVMQEQRARQVMLRSRGATPSSEEHHWRPFQMAFVLLNIPGLVDPGSPDRDIADLLWFPTGGGKTEAYLGLIAFTLALRRLRRSPGDGGGVGVLMRYTLRLLTLQQFERAAGLVCALEVWRRRELPTSEPVSVGLWVGQAATPNNLREARKALRRAEGSEGDEDSGNPRQLLRCPWCGSDLPVSAYVADTAQDRLVVRCPGAACEFADGIPVHLIDSDVYRFRPSLLIGTVDKFALLAWEERARNLFGTAGAVAPPDLIVQDELHLISGPLGTLVGLYETAVDAAATGGARPKLVASTATIRRATDQVRAVFDRESQQFPPPGIDPDDSFFAVAAPAAELPTRQYVGVMAPGTSHATLLVRAYAALLQGAHDLAAPDGVKDAYWTLLGYFNSLRVLGAAYMQTIDDVPDRLGVVARRQGTGPRDLREPRELTSRKRSSEIPDELDRLGTAYPDPTSPDVVLATNMISVGVDVDRLGLMVVMGQPQTTSEYIQATSRVGRQRPGLVVTLYNAARTRDLSHYESFVPYHRALYRQVEATGATPFAPRAVDRGLHGMLVAAARLLVPGAAGDDAVDRPLTEEARALLTAAVLRRVGSVAPDERPRVMEALEELFEEWSVAVRGPVSRYAAWQVSGDALIAPAGGSIGRRGGVAEELLHQFPVTAPPWPTLTSLRNVDAESTLFPTRRRRNRA